MKKNKQDKKSNALVPAGKRIDHPEDMHERKQREMGAAFNRMGSDSDAEAHNAFDKARLIAEEAGITFTSIFRDAKETRALHRVNESLGKQLKMVMHENAKYRAMHLSYKIKGRLIQAGRVVLKIGFFGAPLIAAFALFQFGYVSAIGGALLFLLIGLYNAVRGLMKSSGARTAFGTIVLLAGIIALSVTSDRDAPFVHKRELMLIENMNRDHELGPKILTIDYPLSHLTMVATILGIRDAVTVTVEGGLDAKEISCAKYYEDAVLVRTDEVANTKPPENPDIFHSVPVATFGSCDLYTKFTALPDVKAQP